ncbi:MAG TPA: DapH/DapD/GlmU-related protein [Streptosporangiaceae bacterium]|nr:DapH/DapD/GlmU-related protein [Streptosporangiaceae bacterium]
MCDLAQMFPAAHIAPTAIIGNQFRPLLDGREVRVDRATQIGADVWIGHYTTVGQGVTIGDNSILEEYVGVEPRAEIGMRALVASRSWIGIGAKLGDESVTKGYIGDHARVGARCRIFGDLIHRQLDPSVPWDAAAAEEPAPWVKDGAFVGWRALVVGGVNIGEGAYVCAGALITRDVPPWHIAYGRNQIRHPDDWPGTLGKSSFFPDRRQIRQATPIGSRPRRLIGTRPWVSVEPSGSRRRAGSSRR